MKEKKIHHESNIFVVAYAICTTKMKNASKHHSPLQPPEDEAK